MISRVAVGDVPDRDLLILLILEREKVGISFTRWLSTEISRAMVEATGGSGGSIDVWSDPRSFIEDANSVMIQSMARAIRDILRDNGIEVLEING
jgi:hypothetical protein